MRRGNSFICRDLVHYKFYGIASTPKELLSTVFDNRITRSSTTYFNKTVFMPREKETRNS